MKRYAINFLTMALTFSIGWVVTAIKPRDKQISAEDRKAEEYAVYSALINEFCANNDRIVLIQARTSSCYLYDGKTDEAEFIRDNLPSAVSRDTLDDYKAVDRQIEVLTDNFVLNNRYLLLSEEERKQWFQSMERIRSFHEKYPRSTSITLLSRVGFNHKMDEALVYRWGYCGGECGGGGYYLFKKENGVWRLKQSKTWIS
jgi:hypothetical protein